MVSQTPQPRLGEHPGRFLDADFARGQHRIVLHANGAGRGFGKDLQQRFAGQGIGGGADPGRIGRIGQQDHTFLVLQRQTVGGVVDDRLQMGLAVQKRLSGFDPVIDIGKDHPKDHRRRSKGHDKRQSDGLHHFFDHGRRQEREDTDNGDMNHQTEDQQCQPVQRDSFGRIKDPESNTQQDTGNDDRHPHGRAPATQIGAITAGDDTRDDAADRPAKHT